MDLTKEFVKVHKEKDRLILEINQPNDVIGDFAFEWDIDGSQRKRWQNHLKELEESGTLGDLVYRKIDMLYCPALDDSNITFKKSSVEFIIFDVSN